ncbi:MAG: dihydroorotate dehydrogenase-like protein [Chloroflexota bacterium]
MSPDLRTRYLGLELASPIVASSTPMTGDPATCKLIEAAGAGALVLPSLFEEEIVNEEIELSRSLDAGTEQFAEALGYFPNMGAYKGIGDRYLARLEKTRRMVSIPVIASLNAATSGGWVRYARLMQDAGADALELNLYHLVADPSVKSAYREAMDLELIAEVRAAVTIPLAVKLSPYYSALAGFAASAVRSGADGLVLFNRFYQPDLDLETLDVVTRVALSHPSELRLPMRWIAILRPQLGTSVGLAATSGIHSGNDVAKALLVGADVAMTASAVLRHGPDAIRAMLNELTSWMTEREYDSVSQLRGSASAATVADPTAFERANYMATLHSWSSPHELTT